MMITNTKKVVGILIIIAVVLTLVILGLTMVARPGKYSLVVLRSGEIFIGKLRSFPTYKLVDPWVPQASADRQSINLVSWKNTLWGPENVVYINRNEVMYSSPISPTSQVFQIVGTPQADRPVVPAPPAAQTNPPVPSR